MNFSTRDHDPWADPMPSLDGNVRVDDIPWTLAPLPRPEDADVLSLTPTELLNRCLDLQESAGALRATLHIALRYVETQSRQLQRSARVIEAQRLELRKLHQERIAA
jgi:hypothetical protein